MVESLLGPKQSHGLDEELIHNKYFKIIAQIQGYIHQKMLVLESCPEFVTEEKIREIKELVPDKFVEVAIGLEIKNDIYRRVCLNKGFSLKTYNRAADIITRYINLRTYVFLTPPLLTEKESIDVAVETVEHAFERGSSTVSLESSTQKKIRTFSQRNKKKVKWEYHDERKN